jgi:hypothetical protein
MKVYVKVDTGAAIRLGKEPRGVEEVDLNLEKLTPEQREELAQLDQFYYSDPARYPLYLHAGEATEETVVAELTRRAEKCATEKAEHAAHVEALVTEYLAMTQEEFNNTPLPWSAVEREACNDPRLAQKIAERRKHLDEKEAREKAEAQMRREREERRKAEAEAEAAALQEKREAEKAAWIAEHGSERLKLAHAGGYNCHRLYLEERVTLELGEGWLVDLGKADWEERVNPSLEALKVATTLPKGYEGEVVWLTKEPTRGYEYEGGVPCEAVKASLPFSRHYAFKLFDC